MLALLLALDITLLGAWQGLDPLTRNVEEFPPQQPEEENDKDIMYKPLLEHCSCTHMPIWIGKLVMLLYYYVRYVVVLCNVIMIR